MILILICFEKEKEKVFMKIYHNQNKSQNKKQM